MKRLLIFIFSFFYSSSVFCDGVGRYVPSMAPKWGYNGGTNLTGPEGNFVLGGLTGFGALSTQHGTWYDEWAVIAVIARKIVEHGGYFCPYQIQCINYDRPRSFARFFRPTAGDIVGCAWLCEQGYAGENCQPNPEPIACDNDNYTKDKKFAALAMKTSGYYSDSKDFEIEALAKYDYSGMRDFADIFVGVTSFMNHGVIAEPVRVDCWWTPGGPHQNYDSYVRSVFTQQSGEGKKLLCAMGYKTNSTNTDCEPVRQDVCNAEGMAMCDGFSKDKFNKETHKYKISGNCVKFICKDETKSFVSSSDFSCVDCGVTLKAGTDTNTGLCIDCSTGERFDKDQNKCISATAYTKTDMMYGKGKNKSSQSDVKKQCWTIQELDKYVECVKGN